MYSRQMLQTRFEHLYHLFMPRVFAGTALVRDLDDALLLLPLSERPS